MKVNFALAEELFIEQRYYSHRSQNTDDGISKTEVHQLRNKFRLSLLTNYLMYAFFFLMLSLILIIDNSARIESEFYIILIPLYIYILAFSTYTTVSFLEYTRNTNSIRMLGILPVKRPNLILFQSWFFYSGSLGIFLLVPASFIYISQGGSILEVPLQFINAVTSIILGYSIGSLVSNIRRSPGSVRVRALRNVLRNAAIAAMFLIFYAGISFLPNSGIMFTHFYRSRIFIFIPFINFPYAFHSGISDVDSIWQVLQYSLYAGVSFLFLAFSSKKSFMGIIEGGSHNSTPGSNFKSLSSRKIGKGYFRPSVIKDSKLILRESLPSLLVFTPLFLIFPYDISLLSISYSKEIITLFMVFFSSIVSVISAACYSIAILTVESGGIQYLSILFPDQKRALTLKMLSSVSIFLLIYIPMIISAIYISGIPQILWPGIVVSSISLFCITLTLSLFALLKNSRNVTRMRGISTIGTPAGIARNLYPGSALSVIITIISVYISLFISDNADILVEIWSTISLSVMLFIVLKYCIPDSKQERIRLESYGQ